jgi:hypothetical protein
MRRGESLCKNAEINLRAAQSGRREIQNLTDYLSLQGCLLYHQEELRNS